MLSISLRFHCLSPDHAKHPRSARGNFIPILKITRDELPMEQGVYGGCLLCPLYPLLGSFSISVPCLMIQRSSLECRCDFAIIRRKVLSAYPPYLRFTRRKANWRGHFFKLLRHSDRGDKLSWVGREPTLSRKKCCIFKILPKAAKS